MDYAAYKRELLKHLIRMASLDWAKDQSWNTAKSLAREFPAVFSDLPALLTQAMTNKKEPK